MTPDESRQVLELVDRLQDLVVDLVNDVLKGRDPMENARAVQTAMDNLRHVAKLSCENRKDPDT